MAYVDIEGRRFDNLEPWREWTPSPAPAIFGFFIVTNPREEWNLRGVTVRREAHISTSEEIRRILRTPGVLESWMLEWEEEAVYPGEVFAVGTYALATDDPAAMRRQKLEIYNTGHFAPIGETSDRQLVEQLTQDLHSDNSYWKRIRLCLEERGVDPQTALMADIWSEDVNLEHGIIVTAAGQVFEFDFDWLHKTRNEGSFREWKDVTALWGNIYGWERVDAALQLAKERSVS